MITFRLLLSVIVSGQLAATPTRLAKNTLPSAMRRQIERAIFNDDTRMLTNLLSNNDLSVNSIMLHGQKKTSLLSFAAMNSKKNAVRYLVEQGADLIDVNFHPDGTKYKDTLISFAKSSGDREIAAILEGIEIRLSEDFLDKKSFSSAAAHGDIRLVQNLLVNFEEISEDRGKRLLVKEMLDAALLAALRSRELVVVDTILSWQLSSTTKKYLDNLPPEMRPMHDEPVIREAITLAENIEKGRLHKFLTKKIYRVGNVSLTTHALVSDNELPKIVINILRASKDIEGLWQNLLAIASSNSDKKFVDWKFKEKHAISNAYTKSIKIGLMTHLYFSKMEAVVEILKDEGADEGELDELLLAFAEFTPVIPNSNLMAVKLNEGGENYIDDAVEYAIWHGNSGHNNKTSNLKMIYNGLKNLGNREYIKHFEQLIGEQMLERIR